MRIETVITAAAIQCAFYCVTASAQTAPAEATPAETPPAETQPVPAEPAEKPAAQSVTVARSTIVIRREVRYADVDKIDRAVVNECNLPQRQAELIEAAARKAGVDILRDEEAVKAGKGRILHIEIVDAVSSGNAFIGHRKIVSLKGRMVEDGKELGSFWGRRSSMGGFGGGFMGSCAVLERCLATLAQDVTMWMKYPMENARIGE